MTTRKKVLTSTLFFVSGASFMLGIVKHNIMEFVACICGVVIAICCMKDGRQE